MARIRYRAAALVTAAALAIGVGTAMACPSPDGKVTIHLQPQRNGVLVFDIHNPMIVCWSDEESESGATECWAFDSRTDS